MSSMHAPRSADPVDMYVGGRIRERRQYLSMSQETLGGLLGVTFQQVQKYERGANRVGAGRLWKIADVLQVSVAYFFEGVDGGVTSDAFGEGRQVTFKHQTILSDEEREIVDTILKIKNPAVRKKVLELARSLADASDE